MDCSFIHIPPFYLIPDGMGALGPSDVYHLQLYRRRGLTLKEPAIAAQGLRPRNTSRTVNR